ncbi:MAG: hypothetical protein ABF966_09685 [Bifidobacterium psychraerophilum]|uniref:hypothetical protein n=1 Tax=Bifidobacterium psychraerophilum TaxID=218140 RepID=UPI0039E91591
MNPLYAVLYYGDSQIRFEGAGTVSQDGLIVNDSGIEGWWGAPDLKVDVTERASGNGGHDVSSDAILYASRTVTVNFTAIGDVRSEVLDAVRRVSGANGLPVRLRVVDDRSDTFVSGYVRPQFGSAWNERFQSGTLTVVCPRPERLSWAVSQLQLFPVSVMRGGLSYGGGTGLRYGLSYGTAGAASNVALLTNQGSSPAFPVLTVTGPFPDGVLVQWSGGDAVEYAGAVGAVPLVLDSRSQTAVMGGVDVSRNLTRRSFPVIQASGSVSLRLMSAGTGWVTAVCRDTYI